MIITGVNGSTELGAILGQITETNTTLHIRDVLVSPSGNFAAFASGQLIQAIYPQINRSGERAEAGQICRVLHTPEINRDYSTDNSVRIQYLFLAKIPSTGDCNG